MHEDNEPKTNGSTSTAVIVAVVMLVAGGLGGYGIARASDKTGTTKSSSSSTPSSSTKAADLRSSLVSMGVQHMSLTSQAVDSALAGSPDASAFGTALNTNGTDLGAAIGSVYGADAQKTFDSVWQLHLDEFVKYAVADKNGDAAGKQAALNTIDSQYTKPLAQYLAKANPNLPEATLESSLREHVQMTATMIDDHIQGNYSAEADQLKVANKHLEGLFGTLAEGIVKQYPSKF